MKNQQREFDIVIVGAGVVGAGLACALADTYRIALVDAKLPAANDARLFALNASSCQFLKHIGIWPTIKSNAAPINSVHVSYQGRFGAVRLNARDVNLPSLGHVIPAAVIESALHQQLSLSKNLTIFRPAKLVKLTPLEKEVDLTLDGSEGPINLHAKLVVGADGTTSTVRQLLNGHSETLDYAQQALVTKTTLSRSHHHIAYERFNHHGAIAMLPLINNQCATIWTADNAKIKQLMALSDQEFLKTLQQSFGYRLGRLQAISQRFTYPLRQVKAANVLHDHVILLGNAAHTMHPIAAQCFNLALFEAAMLVDKLREDGFHALSSWQQAIQNQQKLTLTISHQLSQLFNHRYLGGAFIPVAMMGLDVSTLFKKQLLSKMLGRSDNVPQLLLGK